MTMLRRMTYVLLRVWPILATAARPVSSPSNNCVSMISFHDSIMGQPVTSRRYVCRRYQN